MATQREIELCQEIIGLAIQVNIQGTHTIWVGYRGHINALNVQISPPWTPDGPNGLDRYFHLSGSGNIPSASLKMDPSDVVIALEKVKTELTELLTEEVEV